jgi:PadR family transcriptional regulator
MAASLNFPTFLHLLSTNCLDATALCSNLRLGNRSLHRGGKLVDYGIKLSYTTAIILQALANGYQYGFDIIDVTGLPSGTVYPALRRFEEVGLCDSRWEADDVAEREQRSPRRYYELTKDGRAALAEALKRYRALENFFVGAKKPKPSDA